MMASVNPFWSVELRTANLIAVFDLVFTQLLYPSVSQPLSMLFSQQFVVQARVFASFACLISHSFALPIPRLSLFGLEIAESTAHHRLFRLSTEIVNGVSKALKTLVIVVFLELVVIPHSES